MPGGEQAEAAASMGTMLSDNLVNLNMELRAQGLVGQVRPFNGENTSRFAAWYADMQRCSISLENQSGRIIQLALLSLKGNAADYAVRYIKDNPRVTWDTLKAALKERYEGDKQYSQQQLKRIKQNKGESIESFTERILILAEAIYGNDLTNNVVQLTLKDAFLDGILDGPTAKLILKKKPQTLEAAKQIALNEQQTNKTFKLIRRQEEDMEVDAINSKESNKIAELEENIVALTRKMDEVLTIQKQDRDRQIDRQGGARPKMQPKWTPDGRPICLFCNKEGHKIAECWKKHPDKRPKENGAFKTRKTFSKN